MKRNLSVLTLTLFVLGFAIPNALGDAGMWLDSTKDKTIRGVENGAFGMVGEVYHHIDTRADKGAWEAWGLGTIHGLHRGLVRTLVGAYELATPFYHDEPVLSELDTLFKS